MMVMCELLQEGHTYAMEFSRVFLKLSNTQSNLNLEINKLLGFLSLKHILYLKTNASEILKNYECFSKIC